ncbi:DNA polymerase III, subunit gamma/tau [Desulfocapsa sulfexigens DSM 10523]|uniref:DNA polymerase III subunit gamma/tau n=1 Tax=Desulfocapsa sulfexigens (strain DSM 10523 / SB164P1) TaxID=1167006 RepID=M1PJX3_DESSD|nr:DNA polymerase III subunit gamma/tau [Desulfocapsa sulfexigens]AGF79855.1 DNA polymerase III, subunit gamma/tau [Desulfocapsa sulfexigens DSM 10523]
MSYLVLARKSRPQNFNQVVGQIPVVKTLMNSIVRNRIAHAILFSGVRGVGKTTLARIMAKAINCEQKSDGNPCNRCQSCTEITTGSSLDLYEIDGASNRGIQEIRELKEKIRFLPTSSKYKIIIIDEVHMLTTEAFNALLKTLEEPPDHVFFMFATTELHKIPITILSRCQRYELKRVSADALHGHFLKLAEDEGVAIEDAALDLIVRESEGSVRDGLSLLDQVFSYGEKNITVDDVIQVLGLVSRDLIFAITGALLNKDPGTALHALEETFSFGVDLKRFTSDLLVSFRTLILCKIDGCQELLDIPPRELTIYRELADTHSHNTIHMKLNLLMLGVEEMRYSSQPRLTLESTFLKIIQSSDVVPVVDILDKLNSLLKGTSAPQSMPAPPVAKKKIPEQLAVESEHSGVGDKVKLAIQKTVSAPTQSVPTPPPPEEQPPPPQESPAPPPHSKTRPVPHPHQRDVRRDWPGFIEHVKDRKVWMAQDLQRTERVLEVDGELHLRFADQANCALLCQKDNIKLLTEFILDFFQKDLKLRFITPDKVEGKDPDALDSPHRLRQKLANDPLVLMATEIFNGQIGDIRVGPRSR